MEANLQSSCRCNCVIQSKSRNKISSMAPVTKETWKLSKGVQDCGLCQCMTPVLIFVTDNLCPCPWKFNNTTTCFSGMTQKTTPILVKHYSDCCWQHRRLFRHQLQTLRCVTSLTFWKQFIYKESMHHIISICISSLLSNLGFNNDFCPFYCLHAEASFNNISNDSCSSHNALLF